MKKLNLTTLGVQKMSTNEMKAQNGGSSEIATNLTKQDFKNYLRTWAYLFIQKKSQS